MTNAFKASSSNDKEEEWANYRIEFASQLEEAKVEVMAHNSLWQASLGKVTDQFVQANRLVERYNIVS